MTSVLVECSVSVLFGSVSRPGSGCVERLTRRFPTGTAAPSLSQSQLRWPGPLPLGSRSLIYRASGSGSTRVALQATEATDTTVTPGSLPLAARVETPTSSQSRFAGSGGCGHHRAVTNSSEVPPEAELPLAAEGCHFGLLFNLSIPPEQPRMLHVGLPSPGPGLDLPGSEPDGARGARRKRSCAHSDDHRQRGRPGSKLPVAT